ncbi:MAG: DMT family transporter [Catenulispora sp.]|nr:DMT family transporter [Catenulispora sp.]
MGVGALAVSASAVFIHLSGASPGTASFYRCLLALPVLGALAVRERRKAEPWTARQAWLTVVAGALFAGDMLWWTQAIFEVGAGLSTVLVNAQVLIVPLLALGIDHERLRFRYLVVLPAMLVGIVLTGGVLERGVSGPDPTWGTINALLAAICYSGFLYLLRRGGQQGHVVGTYTAIIAVSAVVSLVAGALWRGVDLTPSWPALSWLAVSALCGQVLGWLLVAWASPALASDTAAALLMLTPVGSLVLSYFVLRERPSAWQLAGAVMMIVGAYFVAADRSSPSPKPEWESDSESTSNS